jgi:hypothetical protein
MRSAMAKTAHKLQEVFNKHIPYEIGRLIEMYDLLLKPDPYRSVAEPTRETIDDALIVGFCIHAKNLVEFFEQKPHKHYAAAADYTDQGYQPWEIAHGTVAHELKGKLNNQLSHLSYERTEEPNEKIGVNERKQLLDMIHDQLVRWIGHLKPEYDRSKVSIGALGAARAAVIAGIGGTTNTTGDVRVGVVELTRVVGTTGSHQSGEKPPPRVS